MRARWMWQAVAVAIGIAASGGDAAATSTGGVGGVRDGERERVGALVARAIAWAGLDAAGETAQARLRASAWLPALEVGAHFSTGRDGPSPTPSLWEVRVGLAFPLDQAAVATVLAAARLGRDGGRAALARERIARRVTSLWRARRRAERLRQRGSPTPLDAALRRLAVDELDAELDALTGSARGAR